MKNILITGATGFIGSFLVEEAINKGYNVYATIRNSSNLKYLEKYNINFINIDFSKKDLIIEIINNLKNKNIYFDYIIHGAGLTKANKKEDYYKVNFEGTKNFIDALLEAAFIPKKFVLISSLAAYGPGSNNEIIPIKESDPPNPVTTYGKSKLEAEKYLKKINNFPYIIIRPTAVYGPKEKDIFIIFKLINKHLELYIGNKKQYLTFIYVKDLVKAIFLSLEKNVVNKSYFITDGNIYSSEDLTKYIKKYLNKFTIKLHIPIFILKIVAIILENLLKIKGQVPALNLEKINELESINWTCDISDLKKDLDFYPDYDLEKGIKETAEWYKNEKWL